MTKFTEADVLSDCHCPKCKKETGSQLTVASDTIAMWCSSPDCPWYLNPKQVKDYITSVGVSDD